MKERKEKQKGLEAFLTIWTLLKRGIFLGFYLNTVKSVWNLSRSSLS